MLLSGNWILPLLDRDEPRFAEAAREMWQRGDWAIPRPERSLSASTNHRSSIGVRSASTASWAKAPLPRACPRWVLRSPRRFLLLLWGRRIGQPRAGFHAALMFLTCLQVLMHGRLAVADMPMVFFVTAAMLERLGIDPSRGLRAALAMVVDPRPLA